MNKMLKGFMDFVREQAAVTVLQLGGGVVLQVEFIGFPGAAAKCLHHAHADRASIVQHLGDVTGCRYRNLEMEHDLAVSLPELQATGRCMQPVIPEHAFQGLFQVVTAGYQVSRGSESLVSLLKAKLRA